MTSETANKIEKYIEYLRDKDYISFLYHFDSDESREVYDMFKDIHANVDISKYSSSDARAVVCAFRKLIAYSHVYNQSSIDVTTSRYGIEIKDKISREKVSIYYDYSSSTKFWHIKLFEMGETIPYDYAEGTGFNSLMDNLVGTHYSLFMDQNPKDYYLS